MLFDESKFKEVEILADKYKKIKIYLINGEVLVGESWGIEPAFDDEGEELPYNCLVFKPDDYKHTIALKNEDIIRAEKA